MQKTCIVVPCYNEAKRLDFEAFTLFMKNEGEIDFLFCNDGSSDKTLDLLKNLQEKHPGRIMIHDMPHNSGKAEAVRHGIIEAFKKNSYLFVGFWDADLATPLEEIPNFLTQIINNNKKIAMGSRMKRLGATVERKGSRHFLGRVFSTFSSLILKLPVYDSQCGAKIFRSDLVVLFEEKFITRWLFDVELLARYRNRFGIQDSLNSILEVPVNVWVEKGGSKLKLKDMIKVPLELFAIYKKYN